MAEVLFNTFMLVLINYFYNIETFFPSLKNYVHGFTYFKLCFGKNHNSFLHIDKVINFLV